MDLLVLKYRAKLMLHLASDWPEIGPVDSNRERRAVPGGEGDRFIVEEQPGKAARCPLLLMLALESQRAVIQWSPPWKRTMSWPVCTMPRLPVQAPRSGMATMSPMGVTRLR